MSSIETLSLLVYGNPKVGKSTLGCSGPAPLLVLDAEGSTKFINRKKILWDPRTEAPPLYDGTWEMCVVIVREWGTVQRTYDWLASGQHHFVSVTLDSITEIQRRAKATMDTDRFRQEDWGVLLAMMDRTIRGFRDLTLIPGGPVRCVVFVAEAEQRDNIWKPNMQGAIRTSLPYFVDISGFLFAQQGVAAENGTSAMQRHLLASPHPQYVTGERVGGRLDLIIPEPNITQMFYAIFGADTFAAPAAT